MVTRKKGVGAASALVLPSVEFLASPSSASNLSTYSFGSQPLGTEGDNRYIVAVFGMRRGNTTFPSCTCTINGVSATLLASRRGSASFADGTYMFIAAVPTGTSGTVSFSLSLSAECGLAGLWAVYDIESPALRDVATTSSVDPANMNVDVLAGDVIIAVAGDYGRATSSTWTGATEDYDTILGDSTNRSQSGASIIAPADETPRLISDNRSVGSTTTQSSICGVFR